MNVNTRALDAALNVLGLTLGLPINALVANMHNALVVAEEAGEARGYKDGYDAAMEWQKELEINANESAYINGYAQGAADMQAEDAAEIESLEREVQVVANEQYDDGYLDAVHDYGLSPEGALKAANDIEEARLAKVNRSFEDIDTRCPGCGEDCDDICIFPVDAEDLQ